MAAFTQLDYFADDFAVRAREPLRDGVAFQFEFAGEHFATVTPFVRDSDFDLIKLVREPRPSEGNTESRWCGVP